MSVLPKGTDKQEFVNLYEQIIHFANNYKTVKDLRGTVELNNISDKDVDLSRFKIMYKPADFSGLESDQPSITRSDMVFSTELLNDTSNLQKLSINSSQKTTSTCRIAMQRALTLGANMAVTISAPASFLHANAGFKRDVTLTDSAEETMQEELTWTLNTELNVAGKSKTTATVEILESEVSGSFLVETLLSGKILINLRDKDNKQQLSPIIVNDIGQVFTQENGFHPVDGSPGMVRFTQVGKMFCRFGINQRIRMKEDPIDSL